MGNPAHWGEFVIFGPRLNSFEKTLVNNVRKHGCHINIVSPDEGDDAPSFAYSVGFPETVGQPEVIVFGLPSDLKGAMINEALRMCRDGLQLADGAEIDGLLAGHAVIARDVADAFLVPEYFNSALWYARHKGREPMRAVQLVWPDPEDGLFPWQTGFSELARGWQPELYEQGLNS
ncbi:MAG: DUF4262 domain-containing protein [Sphingomonadales bacterium]|nr:MAG: DUF4262 domain-containing protein [Sphingomonadales bacterium]